jgi:hypothetical protein
MPEPQEVPTSIIGCGCGKWHVPSRDSVVIQGGVVHRSGLPCYVEGESKQLGVLPGSFTQPIVEAP